VTNSSVTIIERVHCQHCGKPAPLKATKRFRFCNDTCRQAAYRDRTGKSAYAGTVRAKTPVPVKAELGLPKDDPEWNQHELELLRKAFRNACVGGVIEVYHHKYGRGVLDLWRPWYDCQRFPYWFPRENRGFARLYGLDPQYPNMAVWDQPRCQFQKNKAWRYLEWRDVWLLDWHGRDCNCQLPKSLSWIHADRTRRVRRNRMMQINFSAIGVAPNNYGTYDLLWSPPDYSATQIALIEQTGGNIDERKPQPRHMDNLNPPDKDGN
jgi:hypothetical protein